MLTRQSTVNVNSALQWYAEFPQYSSKDVNKQQVVNNGQNLVKVASASKKNF